MPAMLAAAPGTPDAPLLMMEAAHVDALEAEGLRAPQRAERAEKCLAGKPGLTVTSTVLEGNPPEAILDEAERWERISSSWGRMDTDQSNVAYSARYRRPSRFMPHVGRNRAVSPRHPVTSGSPMVRRACIRRRAA